jgi:hypothetical protein
MPQSAGATRFLRAAVKAGLRLQKNESRPEGQTISSLQRIKASVQKSHNRRGKSV